MSAIPHGTRTQKKFARAIAALKAAHEILLELERDSDEDESRYARKSRNGVTWAIGWALQAFSADDMRLLMNGISDPAALRVAEATARAAFLPPPGTEGRLVHASSLHREAVDAILQAAPDPGAGKDEG